MTAPVTVTIVDESRAQAFISKSDGDFAELAMLFARHRIQAEAASAAAVAELVEALAACLATLEHTRAFMLEKHGTTNPAREQAMTDARALLARHGQGGAA